jgi:hypothetical protein
MPATTGRNPIMRILRAALVLTALAGPALAQPATVSNTYEASAKIEAVSQSERSVVLRLEDGTLATLIVGPEVRNFTQVKAGDRVVARFTRAIAAQIAKADGAPPVGAAEVAGIAAPGARPAGGYLQAVRVRVTVDAVDTRRNTVTITGPRGNQRLIEVENPRLRAFLRTLRAGNQVDIAYTEAVTLRVLPPG